MHSAKRPVPPVVVPGMPQENDAVKKLYVLHGELEHAEQHLDEDLLHEHESAHERLEQRRSLRKSQIKAVMSRTGSKDSAEGSKDSAEGSKDSTEGSIEHPSLDSHMGVDMAQAVDDDCTSRRLARRLEREEGDILMRRFG